MCTREYINVENYLNNPVEKQLINFCANMNASLFAQAEQNLFG